MGFKRIVDQREWFKSFKFLLGRVLSFMFLDPSLLCLFGNHIEILVPLFVVHVLFEVRLIVDSIIEEVVDDV